MNQAIIDKVENKVHTLIEKARMHYGVDISIPVCKFNLHAQTFNGSYLNNVIRIHCDLIVNATEQYLATTLVHEVAHHIAFTLNAYRKIKPHGVEWRNAMYILGAKADVGTAYPDGARSHQSKIRTFDYKCSCGVQTMTIIRHNRVVSGKASYRCGACMVKLVRA